MRSLYSKLNKKKKNSLSSGLLFEMKRKCLHHVKLYFRKKRNSILKKKKKLPKVTKDRKICSYETRTEYLEIYESEENEKKRR